MGAGSQSRWHNHPDRVLERINELRPQADRNVRGQHVVSKVLLKRFAVPHGSAGHQLYPFDLEFPDRRHRLKGIGACAVVPDFVPFASSSLEDVWSRVESRLPAAAAAVEQGTVFEDERHVEVLKDLIALHFVRSLRFRARHDQVFNDTIAEIKLSLVTEQAALLRAARLQHAGLHLAGPEGLAAAADELLQPHLDNHLSGAELRVRIEAVFEQAKDIIRAAGLQVIAPETGAGEYLIGDTPAITIRQDGSITTWGMALGDSTGVALPLGPKHLLGGRSPHNETITIPAWMVDHLNELQIEAAYRRVYLRPGSGLERFVHDYVGNGGQG